VDPLAFLSEFRAEVTEHLNTLDEQLLRLERNPVDAEPVRAMFLAAHSVKGSAAMLELTEIRDLAHALEDVLGVLRDDRRPLERLTADVFFRAVDRLRLLLHGVADANHQSTPETLSLISELAACTTIATPPPRATNSTAARVLLVEDSPTVRQVESFLLHDAGFVVDAAGGAQEALAFARAMEYVLVIAGIETREMRGPDLIRALREGAPGRPVPVLLTTTDSGPTSPARSRDVVFAPKGKLDADDFLRVVRELMLQAAA
jgi:chemotaxis protein histidine kinase CheA